MVKGLAFVGLLLLAGPAFAQEGASPPVVSSEAPVFGGASPEADAAPVLPGVSGVPMGAASPVTEGAAAAAVVETDLVSLVMKSHPVVQAVMGLLTLAVAAVLTVFLFKAVEFTFVFARLRRAGVALTAVTGLQGLPGDCPLAQVSRAAVDEAASLFAPLTPDLRASARDRLEMALDRIEAGAVMRLRSGTGLLASIGSVAPFVGLFGTVFGIMNSFLAIAATKTTNLAVVAPGIAEALLATGIGLVAAIPAVLLYNCILRRIAAFRHRLADGRAEVLRRFSLELDRRMVVGG